MARKRPGIAQDNEQGLALLRNAGAPFPAAAGTGPPGKLVGRFAAFTLSMGGFALYCYEWEVEFQQDFADGTAHGDFWYNPVPLLQKWTARVKGFALTTFVPNTGAIYTSSRISADPAVGALAAYSDEATQIFGGNAYVGRARNMAPQNGMFQQELELVGVGPPGATYSQA